MEKFEELGLHCHKYYKLETSFYKTKLDNHLLNQLWNEYWLATLSQSPLLGNTKEITKSILDINQKLVIQSGKSGKAEKQTA